MAAVVANKRSLIYDDGEAGGSSGCGGTVVDGGKRRCVGHEHGEEVEDPDYGGFGPGPLKAAASETAAAAAAVPASVPATPVQTVVLGAPKLLNQPAQQSADAFRPESMLPKHQAFDAIAVVENPESFRNMLKVIKELNKTLQMFFTDKRHLDVPGAPKHFRGITVDAVDESNVCSTVARYECPVAVDKAAGPAGLMLDAVPNTKGHPNEFVVTVNTDSLILLLEDVLASASMVLFVVKHDNQLKFRSRDAEGNPQEVGLRILDVAGMKFNMPDQEYRYHFSVPASAFRKAVQVGKKLRDKNLLVQCSVWSMKDPAATAAMTSRKARHTSTAAAGDGTIRFLSLEFETIEARVFRAFKVFVAPPLVSSSTEDTVGGGGGVSGGGGGSAAIDEEEYVAASDLPINRAEALLYGAELLYDAYFAHKYLDDIFGGFLNCKRVRLDLYGKEKRDAAPLHLRFDGGRPDTYVAFFLAPHLA